MALRVSSAVLAAPVGLVLWGMVNNGTCCAGTLTVRVHVIDEDGQTAEGCVMGPRRGQAVIRGDPVEPDALAVDVDLAVNDLTVLAAV